MDRVSEPDSSGVAVRDENNGRVVAKHGLGDADASAVSCALSAVDTSILVAQTPAKRRAKEVKFLADINNSLETFSGVPTQGSICATQTG